MTENETYEFQPKPSIGIITHHFIDHKFIRRHWHEHLEIIYLVRGSARVIIDGSVYSAKQGSIIVFNSSQLHESEYLSQSNEYYVFMLPQAYFCCLRDNTEFCFDNVIYGDEECLRFIGEAVRNLESLESLETGSEYLLHASLYSLLYAMASHHAVKKELISADESSSAKLTQKIKDKIYESYFEPITIESLAEEYNVSISHLQHLFKDNAGTGITDFLNRTRIENSAYFLKNKSLSVSEAGSRVGFSDYNYFSRVFKKYKGISPTQYRKQEMKNK